MVNDWAGLWVTRDVVRGEGGMEEKGVATKVHRAVA